MKCRFLVEENDIVCSAGASPYVPNVFETEEYCLTDRHLTCSSYCLAMSDNVIDLSAMDLQSDADVE